MLHVHGMFDTYTSRYINDFTGKFLGNKQSGECSEYTYLIQVGIVLYRTQKSLKGVQHIYQYIVI